MDCRAYAGGGAASSAGSVPARFGAGGGGGGVCAAGAGAAGRFCGAERPALHGRRRPMLERPQAKPPGRRRSRRPQAQIAQTQTQYANQQAGIAATKSQVARGAEQETKIALSAAKRNALLSSQPCHCFNGSQPAEAVRPKRRPAAAADCPEKPRRSQDPDADCHRQDPGS